MLKRGSMQDQPTSLTDSLAPPAGEQSAGGGPNVAPTREVRLAIVMYGGSSLAVYINGIAQELLWLAKATAPSTRTAPGSSSPARFADEDLSGSARVYRRLGQYLGGRKKDPSEIDPSDPIRTRFVIDILSGTSAGGINAVFLAKALANMQEIQALKDLWIEEGDVSVLINDKESTRGLPDLDFPSPPKSLLNSRRMYWKLLSAFNGMDGKIPLHPPAEPPVCDSLFVEQLDLYVTATDLGGVILPIALADRVIYEPRYRTVFHFVYATEKATGDQRNDFQAVFNPFLAFAARCTSSLPFVFEPMTLGDTEKGVQSFDPFRGDPDVSPDSPLWTRFYSDYRGTPHFPARAFGDGGALDNKPFSYATEALLRRRADVPVDRKLLYIEPDPADNEPGAEPEPAPDALTNLMKQLHSLPRKETIREDIERVIERNRQIVRINRVLKPLARDIQVSRDAPTAPLSKGLLSAKFLDASETGGSRLDGLLTDYGVGYGGYQRLRVASCSDDLADLVARVAGLKEDSAQGSAVRYLVRAWRDKHYSHYAPVGQLPDPPKPFAKFLLDFDLTFPLRRLSFLQERADELFDIDSANGVFAELGIPYTVGGDNVQGFVDALGQARASLGEAFMQLRTMGRRLRSSSASPLLAGPLAAVWEEIRRVVTPEALDRLLSHRAEIVRQTEAEALEAQVETQFQAIAERLAEELLKARKAAASDDLQWVAEARMGLAAPRAQDQRVSADQAIHQYLAHYFDYFIGYDIVAFPMTYGTDLGEADEVEIFRVSPKDATSLLDVTDPNHPRKKVGGAELGHFGGFLDRIWRENDIMWGRLDGAERLIQALVPPSDEEDDRKHVVDALVLEAHRSILSEELREADRMELAGLIADALARIPPGDRNTEELDRLVRAPAGEPINSKLQAVLRAALTEQQLLDFYRTKYSLNATLPPGPLMRSAARGIHVAGQVLKGAAEERRIPLAPRPLARVARFGQLLTTLVELALPSKLPHILYKHWLALAYFFELLLIVVGAVFHVGTFLSFGWTALAVTTLFSLVVLALSGFMQGKAALQVVIRLLLVLAGISLVAMIVFERKHLGQDLTPFHGESWNLPGLLPFENWTLRHQLPVLLVFGLVALVLGVVVGLHSRTHLRRPAVKWGIVSFELAGTRARAKQILEAWGPDGQMLARANLRLDYGFLIAYSVWLFLACGWATGIWRGGWNVASWIGFFVAWGQLLAGVLDAVEDRALTWLLAHDSTDEAHPMLARTCATLKFSLVAAGLTYFVSGLVRYAYIRWR
jgi:patatin-related protein